MESGSINQGGNERDRRLGRTSGDEEDRRLGGTSNNEGDRVEPVAVKEIEDWS